MSVSGLAPSVYLLSVVQTVEGRLTDFPLEVSLMLRAAEDRPDPGGPGAVVHSRNKSKKATFKQKNKAEFGFLFISLNMTSVSLIS